MEIKSNDAKRLMIETEKGDVVLLLPIGIQLEDALEASMGFSGALKKAIDLMDEKEKKEKSEEKVEDGSQEQS